MINISIKQLSRRNNNIYMYIQVMQCITDIHYIVCLGKQMNFKYLSERMEKGKVSTVTLTEHIVPSD